MLTTVAIGAGVVTVGTAIYSYYKQPVIPIAPPHPGELPSTRIPIVQPVVIVKDTQVTKKDLFDELTHKLQLRRAKSLETSDDSSHL